MEHVAKPRAVSVVLNVTEDGRVIIPAEALKALGMPTPGRLSAEVVGDEVVLDTMDAAIKRAQAYYRQFGPEDVSIADELIAERRAQAWAGVRRAQEALAPFISSGPSVVDELIAERRAEVERE